MSFWALVQDYCDKHDVTEAWLMRRAGLNKGAFTAWRARGVPGLPTHAQVVGLAGALGVDYGELLNALLHESRYLPERAARAVAAGERVEDVKTWTAIHARVQELTELSEGDVDTAIRIAKAMAATPGVDRDSSIRNAIEVLRGNLEIPDYVGGGDGYAGTGERRGAAPTSGDYALAAHDESHDIELEQGHDETP